jgi:Na+/melibiose symporter-like transporter
MAAAPSIVPVEYAKYLVIAGCLVYCLLRSPYSVAWYPMLDMILTPNERGSFFGTMRYSYMLVSGILFYFIGKLMGENPSLLLLQTVIGISGLLLLGSMYCMRIFPEDPAEKVSRLKFGHALQMAVRNSMLMGYAIYACLISIAYTSMIPLTLIYLREYVGVNAGAVQTFSTVGIAGNIAAFFCYGYISRHFRLKSIELVVHFMFLFSAAAMALVPSGIAGFIWIAGVIYFGVSFAASTFMCNNSMELMALARPGNKPMAMAFLQSYQNIGVCIGRMGTALIMGANLLAAEWSLGGLTVSHYQTLFLFYGIIAAVLLVLFPALPSIVPKHKDYYAP